MKNKNSDEGAILIASRIMTPDGTILHSKNVDDVVTHVDENGKFYTLSGGVEERKIYSHTDPESEHVEASLYSTDPFENLRKIPVLESRWRDVRGKRRWLSVSGMNEDDLKEALNISDNPKHLIFLTTKEQEFRKNN